MEEDYNNFEDDDVDIEDKWVQDDNPESDDDSYHWVYDDHFKNLWSDSHTPYASTAQDQGYDWNDTGVHNDGTDNSEHQHNHMNNGSAIPFEGVGQCECGCGSFGGCGDICTYCHHPYSAHSRYKK